MPHFLWGKIREKLADWHAGLMQLLTIDIVAADLSRPPIVNILKEK